MTYTQRQWPRWSSKDEPPIPPYADSDPYELAIRDQADALKILRKLAALDEIRVHRDLLKSGEVLSVARSRSA